MDFAPTAEPHEAKRRSAPELTSLLLELARVVKARHYYEPGDARLVDVFSRFARCWLNNLHRKGSLALEVGPQGFREVAQPKVLTDPHLADLRREFGERGVHEIHFENTLDAEALAGLVEILATDAHKVQQMGGFGALLAQHVPFGITAAEPVRPATLPEQDSALEEVLELQLDQDADEAEIPALEIDAPDTTAPLGILEPEALIELREEAVTDEFSALLDELVQCNSVAVFTDLARRLSRFAEQAFEEHETERFYRVVFALTEHCEAKDQEQLATTAKSFLASLCNGHRLEHLIDFAAQGGPQSVQASRSLLVLEDDAIARLVERATHEQEGLNRDRLLAIVLATSERALPALLNQLHDDQPEVIRQTLRLIGDTQNPSTVSRLADFMHHASPEIRQESARALVRIGSDEALTALARHARNEDIEIAKLALHSLGMTHNARALPPLDNVLQRAIEAKDLERARDTIRALGRMKIPEAARPLTELLQRRARLQRWLRDLKLAAITALESIPGDEAVGGLAQAAQLRDASLRKAAQTALDRRAGAYAQRA